MVSRASTGDTVLVKSREITGGWGRRGKEDDRKKYIGPAALQSLQLQDTH